MRKQELELMADQIELVLARHKIQGYVGGGTITPRFIQFHLTLKMGTKVNKVASLAEELALALRTREVRVYRSKGTVNIEMPRLKPGEVKLAALLAQVNKPPAFTALLGVDDRGSPLLLNFTAPDVTHVLVAGTTGSGKTALARTILASLAHYNPDEDLRIILIDPKRRGLGRLATLPHVRAGVISDLETAAACLNDMVDVMVARDHGNVNRPLVIIAIDELADLIQSGGKAVESAIARLAQRGREAGIHLLACTQKPTAGLIGGSMLANFPVRLVGMVASKDEARYATGVADSGAEKLGGRGDFLLVTKGAATRFQAAWLTPSDLAQIAARGEPQISSRQESHG